ncbi:MAG: hypothetical protein Q4E13_05420 [Clostridia bacterium]|nr:hypothetical protein [Clostridia bacterium]
MDILLGVLPTVLPVAASLLIGVVLRRSGLMSREGVNAIKTIVSNVTLPALLLGIFARVDYSPYSLIQTAMVYLMCMASVYLGRLLQKPLGLKSPFAPMTCAGYEGGMLGYALLALLYGAGNSAEFAVLDLGGGLFINTIFRIQLNQISSRKSSGREIVREVFTSPAVLGILGGVLLGATGIYARLPQWGLEEIFTDVTDFIGAPTSAIILFSVGYDLSFAELKKPACLKTLLLRLCTQVVMLALAIPFCLFVLHTTQMTINALILLCLLPCSYMLPVFSDEPEERSYISGAISVQTIFTILAFAVMAVIG